MPTLNPRLSVTLTPAVAAVLREMSQLAGNSQSAIVGELLETSLPVLSRVVAAMRAAKTIEASAKSEIAAGLERAQAKLEAQLPLLMGEIDEGFGPLLQAAEAVQRRGAPTAAGAQPTALAARRRRGSTPVPVTRGSGTGKTRRKGSVKGGGRGRL